MRIDLDTSGLETAIGELEDWMRERKDRPIDPTWIEEIGRDYLSDQMDVEGVDEFGNMGAFTKNTDKYNAWKARAGLGNTKMKKYGLLRSAVDNSTFEDTSIGEGSAEYKWSWSATHNGQNYAYHWQHEFEAPDGSDRKLRFDQPFLDSVIEEWEFKEARRIEEIFDI